MISDHQAENGSFWDFKGKLDFVDQWFLMSSPVPMAAITIFYIVFVLKIGPEYMRKRQPFDLKNVMIVYNVMQVLISSYLFYLNSRLMLTHGFVSKTCLLEKEDTRQSMSTSMYFYFLAKLTELLDTVFFILRKKDNQITFLHVYHHALMFVLSWSILKYEPTYSTIFIRKINSFVHMIMYGYYGLSSFPSLTKYLWWKKYITRLQLVQFILILTNFVMTYTTSECTPSYPLCLTITMNTTLFIFLFGKFYVESYSKKENMQTNGIKAKHEVIKNGDDIVKNCDTVKNKYNGNGKSNDTTRRSKNENGLVTRKKLMNGNK